MNHTFTFRDCLFWLDDKPLLLQAGEFHYYRTPPEQWENCLNLLKQAGFNGVASYIPWRWHEVEQGNFDFDGHSHPMRNLAGFLDLAASLDMWILPRPGPYIMAETINEGIPDWVFTHYPAVTFLDQHEQPHNIVSYLHPDFLACASRWYRAVFAVLTPRQVTRRGRILAIQLDNEMGMVHWVRNILDINPDTLARFAAYLEGTYADHLPDRYPAAHLVEFLRNGIVNPGQPGAAEIIEDYRRFFRAYLREYAAFLLAEAQANGLEVAPVINIHGFANGGKTFPIGLSQLVEVMELPGVLSATDVYPRHIDEGNHHELVLVNEMTRALQNPTQPLFSMEFQAGGNNDFSGRQSSFFDLHTRLCLSVGMRAINHYLFFDGENHPLLSLVKRHDWGHPVRKDGSLRRHYHRYPLLSSTLAAYNQALTLARPQTVTTIAYQLDDFMTEVNTAATEQSTKIITEQRDSVLFDFIARGLALTHRPFNALELERASLDPTATPTLWVMMERRCESAMQQKLVDYVRFGGHLALIGRLCLEDRHGQPCTLLRDALGVTAVQSDPPFEKSHIDAFGHEDVPVAFVETYDGSFDRVIAVRKGETVGFIKALERGTILVFGAALEANTLDDLDLVHQMAFEMGCAPAFKVSDWADVRLSLGEQGNFLFINNYQDDPIETIVHWQDAPLFDGNPIRLPARQGAILPLEWQVTDGITLHYSTAEVRRVECSAQGVILQMAQADFFAGLSLNGWECPGAEVVSGSTPESVRLHGQDGRIFMSKR